MLMDHLGYLYPGTLPEDMQVLLMQLATEMGGWPDTPAGMKKLSHVQFPLLNVPLEFFPWVVKNSDDNDERDFDSYLDTPIAEYPPVLIAHRHFIDGKHRVWAARRQKAKTIKAIDISCIVDRGLTGVGPMFFPKKLKIPKCKMPE
jgi:hypothetical protein